MTKKQIESLGKLDKVPTDDQIRKLMGILGIEETEGETAQGACGHCTVRTSPKVTFESVKGNLFHWNVPSLLKYHDDKTIKGEMTDPYRMYEEGRETAECRLLNDDDCPLKGGERGKCCLPEYAKGRPEDKIPEDALEVVAQLVECTGCDCLGKHWYLSECSGCGRRDAHLKARYLAGKLRDRKASPSA